MSVTAYSVSVVIPTYNDAEYLKRLLQALSKQRGIDFEVIVSDAKSKDNVDLIVKSFANKLNISLILSEPKGPAHGRNAGAKKARGEWLLFLDADDDIDDPKFISALAEACQGKNWQTATTPMRVKGASLLEQWGTWFNYRYIRLLANTKHPVAPGWCIFTKKSVYNKANGFNEKIQFGEDYDYVTRVGKYGFGFVTSTYYYMDLRRFREEGLPFVLKGFMNEVYRHTHGYNLEKASFDYQFGKHKTPPK